MKKKILIISIISVLCILIIVIYFLNENRIPEIQVSEDPTLKFENELSNIITDSDEKDTEKSSNIVEDKKNIEEINVDDSKKQETEIAIQQNNTQVKSSSKTTNKVENNKSESKSELVKETEVSKEQTTTKVEVPSTESKPKQETKEVEIPPKCNGNNHGVGVGNSNKWFNSKQEAISYYDNLIKIWGDKWENFEIDSETYDKNCPYGYEVWTCPFCGKWTINFYYR